MNHARGVGKYKNYNYPLPDLLKICEFYDINTKPIIKQEILFNNKYSRPFDIHNEQRLRNTLSSHLYRKIFNY